MIATARSSCHNTLMTPRWIALAALVVAAGVIRFAGLRTHGLWIDEIGHVVTASLPFQEMLETVKSQAGAAPLDFIGVRLVAALFGDGTTGARLWAFGWGVLTVPLAYVAGSRISRSPNAGLASAFVVALSPILVLYSREARFYSLSTACAFAIVAVYANAGDHAHQWRRWIAYGVVVGGSILSHYYLALLPLTLGVVGLVAWARSPANSLLRARLLGQLVSAAVAVVLAAPWLLYALPSQLGRSYHWVVPSFTVDRWLELVSTLILAAPATEPASWAAVAVLLLTAGTGLVVRRSTATFALTIVALATVPVIWVLAERSGYQLAARQALIMIPPLALLAGAAVGAAYQVSGRRGISQASVLLLGLVWVVFIASPLAAVMTTSGSDSEDWPAASRFVSLVRCERADIFTNLGAGVRHGIAFYAPELAADVHWLDHTGEQFQDALDRKDPGLVDMAVVLSYVGGSDSPNVRSLGGMRAWFARHGWQERQFGDYLFVYFRRTCSPTQ